MVLREVRTTSCAWGVQSGRLPERGGARSGRVDRWRSGVEGPPGREDIRLHLGDVARLQASVLREAREANYCILTPQIPNMERAGADESRKEGVQRRCLVSTRFSP